MLALSLSLPAAAGTFRYQRTEYRKDGTPVTTNSVAVTGFQPFQYVKVSTGPVQKPTNQSGYCSGQYFAFTVFSLPSQPTAVELPPWNGETHYYPLATVQERAIQCGKDADGYKSLVDNNGQPILYPWLLPPIFRSKYDKRYYVYAPFVGQMIKYVGVPDTRVIRADGCGMVTLKESVTNRWDTTISLGGTAYTVSSITAGFLPKCVRTGNNYSIFLPN